MKKIVLLSIMFFAIIMLFGCDLSETHRERVELLYSGSYENTNDFSSPIQIIDHYETYLLSGYPLNLESDFFDHYILYTHSFNHYALGKDIFELYDFSIENGILNIRYCQNDDIEVSDAEGKYAMIFKINKRLYDRMDHVSLNLYIDNSKIHVLYSKSYRNFHDFDASVPLITNYESYIESGYPLHLEPSFFDMYILYTYEFLHYDMGNEIFLLHRYQVNLDNNLVIYCIENRDIIIMPAYGLYAMIFQIERSLFDSINDIIVTIE